MLPLLLAAAVTANASELQNPSSCSDSPHAMYVTGDSVYLRTGPSTQATIVASVPFSTCLQSTTSHQAWRSVRVAGVDGFMHGRFLASTPPSREPLDSTLRMEHVCRSGRTDHEGNPHIGLVDALLAHNIEAGLPDYYLRDFYDDYCQHIRPGPDGLLGQLERATTDSLNQRFALWTLALAPESAYRQHASAPILRASPLFRPIPVTPRANRLDSLADETQDHGPFYQVFGSRELATPKPPPPNVHLHNIVPTGGRVVFVGNDSDTIGLAGSQFPAGTFTLADDLSVARFDRALPAAVYNPCTDRMEPTTLSDVHYSIGTGRVSASVAPDLQQALEQCHASIRQTEDRYFRFYVIIDETPDQRAIQAVQPRSVSRLIAEDDNGLRIEESRWTDDGQDRAFFRRATTSDCGTHNAAVVQYFDGEWQAVVAPYAWDSGSCGA